jgi:type I restriction enzyme R subunit
MGRPLEIIKKNFGDKESYMSAVSDLEKEIYDLPPRSA